jgi:2'-5' RNA ligase
VRLFAALPVPAKIAAQLAALPRGGLDHARWSPPQDLHITLRFFGEAEEEKARELEEALARVRRAPFGVEIAGLGMFQKKDGAILWAAVASTRKLTALAADINEAAAPLGFEMPHVPYVPHITLARLAGSRAPEAYIKTNGSRVRHNWQAQGFTLMQSGGSENGRYLVRRPYDFPQYI